jgi:hypothetical protein
MTLKTQKYVFPKSELLEKQWRRYLTSIKKTAAASPSTLAKVFRAMELGQDYHHILDTAVQAHDLIVPLFNKNKRARSLSAVKKGIRHAENALHQKYPKPPDKCPKCGQPGLVRFTGYPSPLLLAATRLRYATSGGCCGSLHSHGGMARICTACHYQWISKLPYELKILDYLDSIFHKQNDMDKKRTETQHSFSKHEALGNCPKCHDHVFLIDQAYACQNTKTDPQSCDFMIAKAILKQDISVTDLRQLLSTGKTRLLKGFVSVRSGQKFSAWLTVSPEGKVIFEFDEETLERIRKFKAGRFKK